MMRIIFLTIITTLMCFHLWAKDESQPLDLNLDEHGITVADACEYIKQAKKEKSNWQRPLIATALTMSTSTVLSVLGAIGVSKTCPDASNQDATTAICTISAIGLSMGLGLLAATILIPTSVYAYNSYIQRGNLRHDDLLTTLSALDDKTVLMGSNFENFINIVSSNKKILLEILTFLNQDQRNTFQQFIPDC